MKGVLNQSSRCSLLRINVLQGRAGIFRDNSKQYENSFQDMFGTKFLSLAPNDPGGIVYHQASIQMASDSHTVTSLESHFLG
jgi:hypothetical protein